MEKVIGRPLVDKLLAGKVRSLCLKALPLMRREESHADAEKHSGERAAEDADRAIAEKEPVKRSHEDAEWDACP
jgi:hypothetical protein